MDLERNEWIAALGIAEEDIPHAVILEGSWWRAQRTEWRLGLLEEVRELAFPDLFLGYWKGRPVVYSCIYGAARAVEPAHLFGVLGTPRMAMIGTCGALHPGLTTGDVVVPSVAVPREGVAHLYGAGETVEADPHLTRQGRRYLMERDIKAADSMHLSWVSIFAQSGAMVADWRRSGYESVDMEAATLFAVAQHYGFEAVAFLVVWDQLDLDRSFLDPLDPRGQARLDQANQAVFEAALAVLLDPDPMEGN